MKLLELYIISPKGEIFKGDIQKVTFPGIKAPFTVLPMHAPIISSLASGVMRYTDAAGKTVAYKVAGGFVEVKNNRVTVCTE